MGKAIVFPDVLIIDSFKFFQKITINNSLSLFVNKNESANSTTVVNIFPITVTHLKRVHSSVINTFIYETAQFWRAKKVVLLAYAKLPMRCSTYLAGPCDEGLLELGKVSVTAIDMRNTGRKYSFCPKKVTGTFIDICECTKTRKF